MFVSKGWLLLLWGLSIADWWTTSRVMANGGIETNPFLAGWVESGTGAFVKIVFVGVVLLLVSKYAWRWRPVQVATLFIAGMYTSVALANLFILV